MSGTKQNRLPSPMQLYPKVGLGHMESSLKLTLKPNSEIKCESDKTARDAVKLAVWGYVKDIRGITEPVLSRAHENISKGLTKSKVLSLPTYTELFLLSTDITKKPKLTLALMVRRERECREI